MECMIVAVEKTKWMAPNDMSVMPDARWDEAWEKCLNHKIPFYFHDISYPKSLIKACKNRERHNFIGMKTPFRFLRKLSLA